MASAEGVDQIALKNLATGKYLTASTAAAGAPLMQGGTTAGRNETLDDYDWGNGISTLKTESNGKFLSLDGRNLSNNAVQPNGWYVDQQLKLDQQPDGSYVLEFAGNEVSESWFGPDKFAVVDAAGNLSIASPDAAHATHFAREVRTSGVDSAVAAATGADTAVVVVGSMPFINGREADDRTNTDLAAAQKELVEAVQKVNKHTIVVVENSYPTSGWDKESAPGILWTTHAGQETGHAVADVLFGDYNPSGRLTQTWYADASKLPSINDYDIAKTGMTYQYYQGKPLYPFGYGLSYTSFGYHDIRVDRRAVTADGKVTVSVAVTNTGARAGSDVVQLYSSLRTSRAQQPLKELRAFQKVTLAPHQTKTVTLQVNAADLANYEPSLARDVVETGLYDFSVGSSATDLKPAGPVFVAGREVGPRDLSKLTLAENFDDYQGVTLTDQSKTSGTSAAVSAGSWLKFSNADLSQCGSKITVSASKADTGTTGITVRLDNPTSGRILGTVPVSGTGTRYAYADFSAAAGKVTGTHDVYLVTDGTANIHSFQLTQ